MRFRYIHIVAAVFLILGMGVQIVVSYRRASDRVRERMELEMQVAQEKVRFELYDAYDAAVRLEDFIEDDMRRPEDLLEETRAILKHYPQFFSCYVAFPENRYPEKGKWCCPCSWRDKDTIHVIDFGDAKHDYFTREWYQGALTSGEGAFWSHPYRDEDYDETIFTYSDDMRDKDGNLVCVIASDFSVSWLQRLLERNKPFDEAAFVLYSSSGEWLAGSEPVVFDRRWVISRKTLEPMGIDLVMATPRRYIWESILPGIVVPLVVFILGIVIVAFFIRRLMRNEQENTRLETEKEVMAHELRIAHDIQMGMLPKAAISDERLAVSGTLIPMKEVGGDLYDYRLEGDYLWFIIGDVSGKGVSAALFMSAAVNLFRAVGAHAHSPKELMEEMNAVLSENNPSLTFVTAFIGRLHIPSGELLYCNAGHNAPLHLPFGHLPCSILECEPNIPLGYDGKYAFVEQSGVLSEGETLVLYTDGVTEARNAQRQMLGKARWAEIVARESDLLQAVRDFMGTAEQTDDITLLTICRSKLNKMV